MTETSYCSVCDNPTPGDCLHVLAHRYLDEIVYDPAGAGWTPPAAGRERWETGEQVQAAFRRTDGGPPQAEAKDVQRLVVELEEWMDVDAPLETNLRAAHEIDPRKVSRMVDKAISGARTGELTNPGGFLWTRLKKLVEAA